MHNSILLKRPSHLRNKNTVISIDCGIVKTIKWLWDNGIVTLNCCCGKGKKFGDIPSVIISEDYSDKDIDYINHLIKQKDKRPWLILQYRLVSVNVKNKPEELFLTKKDILNKIVKK